MGHVERRVALAGRRGIIAGGGGGLGRACAFDLGRAGMRLALCDRNAELLERTARELSEEGVEVMSLVLDVREEAELADFFARADGFFGGGLDTLVNVVGGTFRQPFADSTRRGWNALIRTNFTWLLHSIQLAIPRMRAAGGGSIVNFTSIEAHRGAPNFAVYAALKAAVASLGRSLALEHAADGIRVNAIAADLTPTEGMRGMAVDDSPDEGGSDELADRVSIPMRRKGTYEDVGGCALFLASDLSRYVTGQTLHPDGGALASSGWFDWPDVGWHNRPPPAALRGYRR